MTAAEIFASGDYMRSVEAYRAELAVDPNSAALQKGLGTALAMTGLAAEGLPYVASAADRQPANPEIRYAYGFVLARADDYVAAIREFDAALALQPTHPAAKTALVAALLKIGYSSDLADAEAYLDRARKIDPKNPEAVGAYLSYLVKTDQKGKVKNLIPSLSDAVKADAKFAAMLASVPEEFKPTAPAPAIAAAPSPGSRAGLPSPPVRNYQPQYRQLADKKEWQPIAYNIVCVLWIAASAYNCFSAIQLDLPGFTQYMVVTSGLTIAVVIGLLMRSEWIAMIGRAMCILTILGQIFPFWMSLGRQRWGEFGLSVLVLGLAGFMIYLINYENE